MTSNQSMTLQEWAGGGASKVNLALLLTDVVGSTELGKRLGDDAWIEMLISHFKRARELRDQHNCYEVKLIGDAYMVAFRTAEEALQFGREFFIDTGHPEINIRLAIHVGRVRIIDDDIYGLMVNFTSRIIHAIEGKGIIVSTPARDDIVAVLGEIAHADFRFVPANLKSFGRHRLWQYINQDMRRRQRLLIRSQRSTVSTRSVLNPSITPSQPLMRPTISPKELPPIPVPQKDEETGIAEILKLLLENKNNKK